MRIRVECEKSQFLSGLVEDRLAHSEQALLEAHVESCASCQNALDELVDRDETAERVSTHLRRSRPATDRILLDVMDRIRSTHGEDAPGTFGLDDFAVDYLHPSEDSNALGRLGPYEISEVIGRGGMGIVLKGNDVKLNRMVAVKVLAPVFALNSTARKRFLREAQAAAAVGHQNVVTIHSVDEDRLPYLVMEFVDGPSLQARLDAEGFLQLNQILRIGVQVASGLAAAHAQGLVHRDIKPGNILLEKGMERVKLTDFGLARAADDVSMTREGTVVGTPQYMSPEQARGESVDQSSDLFSLGSVLYTLATGRPPFRAESSYGVMRKIIDDSPTAIRDLNPEIPDWLCAIVERLMAKKKEDRFQTIAEVRELLEACLSHARQPTVTKLPLIPKLPTKKRLSPSLQLTAGVAVMIALISGLFVVLGGPLMFSPGRSSQPSTAAVSAEDGGERMRSVKASRSYGANPRSYEKTFVVAFSNPEEIGTLNVDIKRGSIHVTGYDGDQVVVELSVPNYSNPAEPSSGGLRELRPNNLDFDIEKSPEQIKVDGNSYKYITNLTIKVPRKTNLILDSYQDGSIKVQQVAGEFNLRSQNNSIRIEDVSGSARLWSYNGNLSANFVSVSKDRSLYFESYNGSVDATLPADTKANVKYRSGTGKVSTDFEIAVFEDKIVAEKDGTIKFDEFVYGTLNGGGSSLALVTEKGDIRLRKRMQNRVE